MTCLQLYHFPDIIDLNKLSQYYWSGFSVFATKNWFYSYFSTGFRKLYLVHKKCHRCHWFMLNVIQLPANEYNKLQNDYICTLLSSKITRVRGGGEGGAQQVKTLPFFFFTLNLVSVITAWYYSVAFYSTCSYFLTKELRHLIQGKPRKIIHVFEIQIRIEWFWMQCLTLIKD